MPQNYKTMNLSDLNLEIIYIITWTQSDETILITNKTIEALVINHIISLNF